MSLCADPLVAVSWQWSLVMLCINKAVIPATAKVSFATTALSRACTGFVGLFLKKVRAMIPNYH